MSSNGASSGYDVPKEGKAGVTVDEGDNFKVEIKMVPVPEPGVGQLLLKLNATGLCMSDVHFMVGDWGLPPMSQFGVQCAGHEGAGVVVKVGEGVEDWKVGDRGGVKPLLDGTYCQYILSPAKYTSRIPEGVSDYVAAPIMCSASTMHRALTDSGLRTGDWVVFPGGGGGVGIQGVQLARAMGMRPIVIDTGAAKRKLALEMGAEEFVDFKEAKDVPGEVVRIADGLGAHGVLVTAYQSYQDAPKYTANRIGATIMCIALPPASYPPVGAAASQLAFKNLRIIGTLVGTMKDTAAALEYARRGLLKSICEVRGMSQMPESVQQLRRGEIAGRVVIDFNKD